jgi:hypothetical protein
MFDVTQGLWPDLGNYRCVKETSVALNRDRSHTTESEDGGKTGNNDADVELDIATFDDLLELLYEACLILCTETFECEFVSVN